MVRALSAERESEEAFVSAMKDFAYGATPERQVYVILGMHKSGTTLVSQILHRSGIRMGEGTDVDGDYDRGVFFERSDARELNQHIIGFGDPAHEHPAPRDLRFGEAERERMREIVRACEASGESWGFKDPRTCLTYPLWRRELPAHRVILVHRSLEEVFSHFWRNERTAGVTWNTVRTWCDYNERALKAAELDPAAALLVCYERLMTQDDEFARLERFVGHPLSDVRSAKRYRSRSAGRLRLSGVDALRGLLGLSRAPEITARLEALHAAQCLAEAERNQRVAA
jgi:hypothetical protein